MGRFPPFYVSQCSSLTLNQQGITDLKSAAFTYWKSSSRSFSDSLRHPCCRANSNQPLLVGDIFLGPHFIESLIKYSLPNRESTFTLHVYKPMRASLQKSSQCCFGIASTTHSQFHYSRGMKPSQTLTDRGNYQPCHSASLTIKSWEDSYSQGFVILEQCLQNSKLLKFFSPSWMTGRWLEVSHAKPILHVLNFNSSL